jgi:hypothetical protein
MCTSAGSPAPEGSEGEEAGRVAVLRTIGGRSTERNVTLLFGAKHAEHYNAWALVAFVRELGDAAQAVRELTTLALGET